MRIISIFGGSGFIGSELVSELAKNEFEIRLFTRNKIKANHLKIIPRLKFIQLTDDLNIKEKLSGSDIIIDLVGILHEKKGISFEDIHSIRLKKIARIARELGVKRFIHIGALGASMKAPSKYLQSKAKAEEHIKIECSNLAWTIYKPSIVFGENDKFINLFHNLISFLPVIAVISPYAKFQPIWVNDLVEIIITSIDDKKTYQQTYNLAGPNRYSFIDIIKLINHHINKRTFIIPLSKKISYLLVWFMELLPINIITRDNLKSMSLDNTVAINDAYQFKSSLMDLSSYLSSKNKKI
jgi:uncharacterized protein YbjT (DUF2867 family)